MSSSHDESFNLFYSNINIINEKLLFGIECIVHDEKYKYMCSVVALVVSQVTNQTSYVVDMTKL